MNLALVTNWAERCGNAEYAWNLAHHVWPEVVLKVVARPLDFEHIYAETRDVELIHFNCVFPEFREIAVETWPWQRFKEGGKKLTIMVQDSSPGKLKRTAELVGTDGELIFDEVAAHETFPGVPERVRVIPHGILDLDVSGVRVKQKIGTAGFPMPWKGHVPAAYAAKALGLEYLAIMPESHHIDAMQTKKKVLEICPNAEVYTEWSGHSEIIRKLAECFVTVFAYDLDYQGAKPEGISGAVRFGLAAKRPIIVSRSSLFKDLFQYEEEVYFMDYGLESAIVEVADDWNAGRVKVPRKIIREMNWARCAQLYQQMWRDAITGKGERNGL